MSTTTIPARRAATTLPAYLALAAGVVALTLLFLPEARAAVGIWIDSTAYGHCFLVLPIILYLIWDRRESLTGLQPRPTAAFLLLALPLPFAWLVAERLGIMEGRQLVAIGFLEVLLLVTLGWRLYSALLGPLLYLVFLVPFGAFVTPALQTFTAHFIDVGLTILGVPHFSNDMLVEIEGGTFFVAEACAGLRFLIASIAFGVFYALLNYRSPGRRAVFIAASLVIPIVANGLRALGIVLLGVVLSSAQAAAADHIIYGWVFFSAVMLLLVAAGLPLREAPAPAPARASLQHLAPPAMPWGVPALVLIAAIAPAFALTLDARARPPALSGQLAFVVPSGCTTLQPTKTTAAGTMVSSIACGGRTWEVTVQAVAARSTGAALTGARLVMLGPAENDEATHTSVPGLPPGHGAWQVTISSKPPQLTAIATWIHGHPAGGGLGQRIRMARDSVMGNDVSPVLIGLTTRQSRPISPDESQTLLHEAARIIGAQPDLDDEVARLTAPSSPPPRP